MVKHRIRQTVGMKGHIYCNPQDYASAYTEGIQPYYNLYLYLHAGYGYHAAYIKRFYKENLQCHIGYYGRGIGCWTSCICHGSCIKADRVRVRGSADAAALSPLDFMGLLFAGIIMAALGAVMDVSMSIAYDNL